MLTTDLNIVDINSGVKQQWKEVSAILEVSDILVSVPALRGLRGLLLQKVALKSGIGIYLWEHLPSWTLLGGCCEGKEGKRLDGYSQVLQHSPLLKQDGQQSHRACGCCVQARMEEPETSAAFAEAEAT